MSEFVGSGTVGGGREGEYLECARLEPSEDAGGIPTPAVARPTSTSGGKHDAGGEPVLGSAGTPGAYADVDRMPDDAAWLKGLIQDLQFENDLKSHVIRGLRRIVDGRRGDGPGDGSGDGGLLGI